MGSDEVSRKENHCRKRASDAVAAAAKIGITDRRVYALGRQIAVHEIQYGFYLFDTPEMEANRIDDTLEIRCTMRTGKQYGAGIDGIA